MARGQAGKFVISLERECIIYPFGFAIEYSFAFIADQRPTLMLLSSINIVIDIVRYISDVEFRYGKLPNSSKIHETFKVHLSFFNSTQSPAAE